MENNESWELFGAIAGPKKIFWQTESNMSKILVVTQFPIPNCHEFLLPSQRVRSLNTNDLSFAWDNQLIVNAKDMKFDDFDAYHITPSKDLNTWMLLTYYCNRHNKIISGGVLHQRPDNKLYQMCLLTEAGLPYVRTFYTCGSFAGLFDWASSVHGLRLPVIVKDIIGTAGKDNHLITSKHDLGRFSGGRYMMQEYIDNDFDYRVLVFGDRDSIIYKRTRDKTKTHLNNRHQGARAEIVTNCDPEIVELGFKAAKCLRPNWIGGVDIIRSREGKLSVLEVNNNPNMFRGSPELNKVRATGLYKFLSQQIQKKAKME